MMISISAPVSAASLISSIMLLSHAVTATRVHSTPTFISSGRPSTSPLALLSTRVEHHRLKSKHSVPFAHPKHVSPNNAYYQHRTPTQLYGTIDEETPMEVQADTIIERLELYQQFDRWRFMQKLLEGELAPSDIEDVLLTSLHAYLQHGPTDQSANNKNENGGNASPVLTDEQREVMEKLIGAMESISDGVGDGRFLHLLVLPAVDYESISIDETIIEGDSDNMVEVDPNALSILQQIELILPDPIEDEEAFTSSWDVIIDLYGRESVRVNEEALQKENESRGGGALKDTTNLKCGGENLQWRTVCTVGRVLIHYDFFTKGVLKEGTFN